MPNPEFTVKEVKTASQALVLVGGPWCRPCNDARAAGVYDRVADIAAKHGIPFGEITVSSQGELALAYYRMKQDEATPGEPLRIEENSKYQELRSGYDAMRAESFDAIAATGILDNDLLMRGGKWEAMMAGIRAGETELTGFLAQHGLTDVPVLVYFENGQPVACLEIPDETGQIGPASASVTADRFMKPVMSLGGGESIIRREDALAALDASLPTRRSS